MRLVFMDGDTSTMNIVTEYCDIIRIVCAYMWRIYLHLRVLEP